MIVIYEFKTPKIRVKSRPSTSNVLLLLLLYVNNCSFVIIEFVNEISFVVMHNGAKMTF